MDYYKQFCKTKGVVATNASVKDSPPDILNTRKNQYKNIVHHFPGYLQLLKSKPLDPNKKNSYNPAHIWPEVAEHSRIIKNGHSFIQRVILPFQENKVRNMGNLFHQNVNPNWADLTKEELIPRKNKNHNDETGKKLIIPPSPNSRNVGNMKRVAIKKHNLQRSSDVRLVSSSNSHLYDENPLYNPSTENFLETPMAQSSVTIPNWNATRLNRAQEILANHRVHLSRTEIIVGCMKAYIPKLRLSTYNCTDYTGCDVNSGKFKQSQWNKFVGPFGDGNIRRLRKQNDRKKYKFKKISIYCEYDVWDVLQQRCYHARLSLSHAVDIALRLYLRAFVEQMLLSGIQMDRKIKSLLDLGKYQKMVIHKKAHRLEIRYIFDSKEKTGKKRKNFLLRRHISYKKKKYYTA